MPTKPARERAAAAPYAPPTRSAGDQPGTVMVRHEDSGMRLRPVPAPEAEQEIVELPPGYSPD